MPVVGGSRALPLLGPAALVACAAWGTALVLAGGSPQAVPAGLSDPGPVVAWGSRWSALAALASSVVTVGSLVVLALLAPGDVERTRAARTGMVAAGTWTGFLLLGALLQQAEALGVPLQELPSTALRSPAGVGVPVLVALGALVAVALLLREPPGEPLARALLAVALVVGVSGSLRGHQAGGDQLTAGGLAVHVTAALLWTGGLVGLLLHARHGPAAQAAARRYSRLALGCYLLLALTGALTAVRVLAGTSDGWRSGYAAVVLAKAGLLVAAGALGAAHRRWMLPTLSRGRPGPFLRLAAVEVLVMAAAAGLAAALARTPPPAAATGRVSGHDPHTTLPDLGWATVWTQARPDPVVLAALGLLLAWHAGAVRARRRDGLPWPWRGTASFVVGCTVTLVLTCTGVATYAHTRPSLFLGQLLLMMLLVPALLLGGARSLLSTPAGPPLPPVSPAAGALAACGLLVAVQYTPLASWALRSSWSHLALLALAVGIGGLLWWPSLGPARRPDGPGATESALWLLPVVVALAVLALRLRVGDDLLAAGWFLDQRLAGTDPFADQRLAAVATAATAVGLLLSSLVLQWRAGRHSAGASNDPGGHTRSTTVPRSSSGPMAP